jgi:hypothetical protein
MVALSVGMPPKTAAKLRICSHTATARRAILERPPPQGHTSEVAIETVPSSPKLAHMASLNNLPLGINPAKTLTFSSVAKATNKPFDQVRGTGAGARSAAHRAMPSCFQCRQRVLSAPVGSRRKFRMFMVSSMHHSYAMMVSSVAAAQTGFHTDLSSRT